MKVTVINILKLLILIGPVLGQLQIQSDKSKREKFFEDTFEVILQKNFGFKLKYEYPTQVLDKRTNKLIMKRFADPDTMPKLNIYIKWPSNHLDLGPKHPGFSAIPKEFKEAFLNPKKHMSYFGDTIKEIKYEDFEIIFVKDSQKLIQSKEFKEYDISNGGLLSISNVVFNYRRDKALVLIQWFRHKHDASGSLYVFKFKNGKWVLEKNKGLWIS